MTKKADPKQEKKDDINALIARYKEISEKVIAENRQYAIKLGQEETEDVLIKYRLLLRPTARGIMHTLEIMDATEERAAVQIPLVGNWERVLAQADRVLSSMSIEKFREVVEILLKLRERIGSRTTVEEY